MNIKRRILFQDADNATYIEKILKMVVSEQCEQQVAHAGGKTRKVITDGMGRRCHAFAFRIAESTRLASYFRNGTG